MRWLASHIQSPAHRGAMPWVTKDITVTEAQVLIVERQHKLPCEHWCFGKLADLMLTFSSFCFMYVMYGILFILLPYGTAIISFAFLVHMRLWRPQYVYQEFFFFHFGCPCSCYAAVCWVKREILQPEKANHELICLFSFYIFWRLKA